MIGEKIEWLDGDLSTLPAQEETEDTSRRGRNSRGKNSKKPRDAKDNKEKQAQPRNAEEKTAEAPVVADISALDAPQPILPDNISLGNIATQEPVRPAPHKNGNEERRQSHAQNNQQNNNKRHRRDFDDEPSPLGFGDDIPAFMLIPINI